MRNKKLLVSLLIAFFGIITYFITVPTVNEEALVDLTVKAGDKDVLKDTYFSGRLDYENPFYISEQGVETTEKLSYLEQQDVPEDPALAQLQKKYPAFVNPIIYNNAAWDYKVINSTDYLVGGYIEYDASNKHWDTSTLQLKIFNKETDTLKQEEVKREDYLEEGRLEILGMHEAYPVIKILYTTALHSGEDISKDSSILSVGEYNVETQTYSEHNVLDEDGYFYPYDVQSYVSPNNEIQIIDHIQYEQNGSEIGEQNLLVYHFKEDTISSLDLSDAHLIISNEAQLYALDDEEEETVLKHYDQEGEEVLSEVNLELQIPINPAGDYPIVAQIIEDKLYLAQSTTAAYSDLVAEGAAPTPLQVFDINTGESLLLGEFNFDATGEANIREGIIEQVGIESDL